jgi:hypothetical protein
MSKYVLFDLETELIDGPLDLERHVPGITIGATLTDRDDLALWYERDERGQAVGGPLSQKMAQALVRHLQDLAQDHTIVTWNGAGFDFRVLARASGMHDVCVELAWRHVDMMFWLHCQRGFSVALDSAARAAGTSKTAGISGVDAPRLWAAGEYEQVKQYVAQDVRALGAVYEGAMRGRVLRWVNTQGRISGADGQLLSVCEANRLPLPDTSWMRRTPWPREKFVGWMLAQGTTDVC